MRATAGPGRIGWLPPLVLVINLAGLGLLVAYSMLNLRPDLSATYGADSPFLFLLAAVVFAVLAPAAASLSHVRPVVKWLHSGAAGRTGQAAVDVHAAMARRAANAPLVLAAFSLLGWLLVTGHAFVRVSTLVPHVPFGLAAHFVLRPMILGLIAGAATFFATEALCRTHVWPALLAGMRIAGNPGLRRVRVAHRLLVLWAAISVLPLSVVALTTFARIAGTDAEIDPLLVRVASVVLLVSITAAVAGAWLAWLVSRSIARPLEALEAAMSRLRDGHFDTREPVNSTDEIGSLAEGFNLMAGRLAESYAQLEVRNRELTRALDRVDFLEHVKHSLDRFVPETVRRAIENNPAAPELAKQAKDVTVLFLDIEGYTRLSEQLPRPALNSLVERYFSLYLASIRAEGGDINETAGDGLMIIFQAGEPAAHAASAVRAALAIRAQTVAANRDAHTGQPPIRVNIGISSGECDVGATRFEGPAGERWTFTASGPVTNLAARLGNHATGGQILLAAETARRVRDHFPVRSLGPVALKNISHPVEAWEVQGAR